MNKTPTEESFQDHENLDDIRRAIDEKDDTIRAQQEEIDKLKKKRSKKKSSKRNKTEDKPRPRSLLDDTPYRPPVSSSQPPKSTNPFNVNSAPQPEPSIAEYVRDQASKASNSENRNLQVIIKKDTKFDEVPKLQDLTDSNWGNRIHKYITRHRKDKEWTEKDLKKAIIKGLNGNVTTIDSYDYDDATEFLKDVLASIGQTLDDNSSLTIIRSLKQTNKEEVKDFNARYIKALSNCSLPPNVACDYYVHALKEEIMDEIKMHGYKNVITELFAHAIRIESVLNKRKGTDKSGKSEVKKEKKEIKKKTKKEINQIEESEEEDKSEEEINLINEGKCFVCGRVGHPAKFCRFRDQSNNRGGRGYNNNGGRPNNNQYRNGGRGGNRNHNGNYPVQNFNGGNGNNNNNSNRNYNNNNNNNANTNYPTFQLVPQPNGTFTFIPANNNNGMSGGNSGANQGPSQST